MVQHPDVARPFLIGIRRGVREGYVEIIDGHFTQGGAAIAPRPVDQPIANNGQQPGHERPLRIVGGAHHVQRQQHVLHEILHGLGPGEAAQARDHLAHARRDRAKQFEVGLRLTGLCRLHQSAELVRWCAGSHGQPQVRLPSLWHP